jgi:hypothetical protein
MNPRTPSIGFLRRVARLVLAAEDPRVREWAEAMERAFSRVSIVKTYRARKLCGYEVWRHLAPSGEDPRRHKARLWFGVRHWRSELGYPQAALDMARKAAERMQSMSRESLVRWWQKRQRYRAAHGAARLPDEHLRDLRIDFNDLTRMSHVYQHKS